MFIQVVREGCDVIPVIREGPMFIPVIREGCDVYSGCT